MDEINNNLYDEGVKVLETLEDKYKNISARIELAVATFILLNSVKPTYGSEYTLLINEITQNLNELAIVQERIMANKFSEIYKESYKVVTSFEQGIPQELVNSALEKNWAGRTFSKSVWSNTEKLKDNLIVLIDDVINTGMSKDKAVEAIRKNFGASFYRADALVRTETQYFINQAQGDGYMAKGFKSYRYVATKDERTSKVCQSLDGKVFKFSEAVVGVNYPPAHVNCRSTIVPIID